MKTLKFREYKGLNENLNHGFLEPTEENIRSFAMDYSKVSHNSDGSIDYGESVDVAFLARHLKRIPFNFNYVAGDFLCGSSNITSLLGSPIETEGSFTCPRASLRTLQYGPKKVGKNFTCAVGGLVSLKHGPIYVGGDYICSANGLENLQYIADEIGGDLDCNNNFIDTLKYFPKSLGKV